MTTPLNNRPGPEHRTPPGPGEDTLRLIATLPAPDGLAVRVHAGLHAAPHAGRFRMGRSPLTPPGGWLYSGAVRGLAAAAIVCVVAGGGWRIYSHVQPAVKVVVIPAPVSPAGNGFRNAGATRVPDTIDGTLLTHPVPAPSEVNVMDKVPAQPKAVPGSTTKKKKSHVPPAAPPVQ